MGFEIQKEKMPKLTAYMFPTKGKLRKRWPAYAIEGHWAITVCAMPWSYPAKPWIECPRVEVTHQPTGYKAADIPKSGNYTMRLNRMNEIFGNASTVKGVVRKYKRLSDEEKKWVRGL